MTFTFAHPHHHFREDDRFGLENDCIYILRISDYDEGTVIRDCNFFSNSSEEESILNRVHDFEIQGPYMFATRRLVGHNVQKFYS